MGSPRTHKNRDLPTGLVYRKDRDNYQFTRIDGSTKNLGKDRKKAKSLAFKYNATYRVDPELFHEVSYSKKESAQNKVNKVALGEFLPAIFIKVAEDKQWETTTLKGHEHRFNHILSFFSAMLPDEITLEDVNQFLKVSNPSDSKYVYNRYLGLLKVLFSYCVSESVMQSNPAEKKIRRTLVAKDEAEITRLTTQDFAAIHKYAGNNGVPWLQIAMELSLQTSHAVNEISKLKYIDIEDHISIQRNKNKKTAASRVKIPMNYELESIVQRSKNDGIDSPYVTHFMRERRYLNRSLGKGLDHPTQLRNEKISRAFSDARDELGLYKHIKKKDRPTFHDIRSLSIHLQEESGHDAQKRAAHSQRSTTDGYKKGHIQWNEVNDVVIKWREEPPATDKE